MIKGNATTPRIISWSERDPAQIDRVNEITGNITINQDKLYEVGRTLKMGVHKLTPDTPITINQNEYLTMAFWRDLAGIADPETGGDRYIDLDDLKDAIFDISASYIDEDEVFQGTVHFPKMRLGGFSINIGDPEAKVLRSFNCVGELCRLVVDNYLAYAEGTASGASHAITFGGTGEPPLPLEDTIFKVIRIRSGVVSEPTTYSYVAGTLTITGCEVGDIHKVIYPAATAYTTLWTDNDVDPAAAYADQCEIYLRIGSGSEERIYKLQSVNIDGTFDRTDYEEIGNREKTQFGVREKTVTVTLNRLVDDFSLEQILADQADPGDSKIIDVREFSDEIGLVVKIYTDNTKTSFAYGIRIDDLSPTTLQPLAAQPEEMNPADNALESDNFLVTDSLDDLGLS